MGNQTLDELWADYEAKRDRCAAALERGKVSMEGGMPLQAARRTVYDAIVELQHVVSDLSEKVHGALLPEDNSLNEVEDRPRIIGSKSRVDGGFDLVFGKRDPATLHLRPIGAKRTADGLELIYGEVP